MAQRFELHYVGNRWCEIDVATRKFPYSTKEQTECLLLLSIYIFACRLEAACIGVWLEGRYVFALLTSRIS